MSSERRSTSRPVIIGILTSLAMGALLFYLMRFLHGAGEFPWQMLLVFVIMGFVGAMVWWQAKKAWSLALILIIELTIFDLIAFALIRAPSFVGATVFLAPVMFLLLFIGAKLAYWTRDYIEYRWGD